MIQEAINNLPSDMKNKLIERTSNIPSNLSKWKAPQISSDERLKSLFGEDENIIDAFSKINAISFNYNDTAHNLYTDEKQGVDYDNHIGVKAQELENNPITSSTVKKDENGYLAVDTNELTMSLAAVVSELCKEIKELRNQITNK